MLTFRRFSTQNIKNVILFGRALSHSHKHAYLSFDYLRLQQTSVAVVVKIVQQICLTRFVFGHLGVIEDRLHKNNVILSVGNRNSKHKIHPLSHKIGNLTIRHQT
jgi:hypothetical protein